MTHIYNPGTRHSWIYVERYKEEENGCRDKGRNARPAHEARTRPTPCQDSHKTYQAQHLVEGIQNGNI